MAGHQDCYITTPSGVRHYLCQRHFEWLVGLRWCQNSAGYAYTYTSTKSPKGQRRYLLHRLLAGANPGEFIDHIDGDKTNNVPENLRKCSNTQNLRNSKKRTGTTSSYKGVSWDRQNKKWLCGIRVGGKTFNLGRFTKETDAAMAYDLAAKEKFGEFARTNF